MSVQTRPVDVTTVDYLQLGMPYIEFAPLLSGGTYGPYSSLGIVDSAEIAKELATTELRSSQSGVSVLIRELVQSFDATLNVGLFQHSDLTMQYLFGCATTAAVSGGNIAVVDDPFTLTDDEQDFLNLANVNIDESTQSVSAAEIIDEAVGTGDGTLGDASGDYSLDFKPLLVADVTSVTVGGVAYTPIAVAAAASGNEVEVVVGTGATSGDLQFFQGGVAVNVTGEILATYEPSHAFVLNTDFVTEPKAGRVRMLNVGAATDALKSFQPMESSYTYAEVNGTDLDVFTQFVFNGKTRVRLLTDVGVNMIWVIPSTSIRLTDDAFTFNRDEPQVSTVAIQLLDAGGSSPFGTMRLYREGATA